MISVDTKAALYLTCRLPGEQAGRGQGPLSLGEYNKLAKCLQDQAIRPAALFSTAELEDLLSSIADAIEPDRIKRLLGRGVELSIRISDWESSGIRIYGRSDSDYPQNWRPRLKAKCPPVVFAIGDMSVLSCKSIGVVGSRNVDDEGKAFAEQVAQSAVRSNCSVVSGYARGVDQIAMKAALDCGGAVIGMLADSLMRNARKHLEEIEEGRLLFLTTSLPGDTHFVAWKAMERNKYIYAASVATVVVDSARESGGTWAGATEAMKNDWTRVYVRAGGGPRSGRKALEELGASPLSELDLNVSNWTSPSEPTQFKQGNLFEDRE